MRIISFTEARNALKSVLDQVVNDADCAVITRRDSEAFLIGDDIKVTVCKTESNQINVAISAPDEVLILRSELLGLNEEAEA